MWKDSRRANGLSVPDEVFENALKDAREENLAELKTEVKTVERLIERLLTQLLECSTSVAERDFHVCGV